MNGAMNSVLAKGHPAALQGTAAAIGALFADDTCAPTGSFANCLADLQAPAGATLPSLGGSLPTAAMATAPSPGGTADPDGLAGWIADQLGLAAEPQAGVGAGSLPYSLQDGSRTATGRRPLADLASRDSSAAASLSRGPRSGSEAINPSADRRSPVALAANQKSALGDPHESRSWRQATSFSGEPAADLAGGQSAKAAVSVMPAGRGEPVLQSATPPTPKPVVQFDQTSPDGELSAGRIKPNAAGRAVDPADSKMTPGVADTASPASANPLDQLQPVTSASMGDLSGQLSLDGTESAPKTDKQQPLRAPGRAAVEPVPDSNEVLPTSSSEPAVAELPIGQLPPVTPASVAQRPPETSPANSKPLDRDRPASQKVVTQKAIETIADEPPRRPPSLRDAPKNDGSELPVSPVVSMPLQPLPSVAAVQPPSIASSLARQPEDDATGLLPTSNPSLADNDRPATHNSSELLASPAALMPFQPQPPVAAVQPPSLTSASAGQHRDDAAGSLPASNPSLASRDEPATAARRDHETDGRSGQAASAGMATGLGGSQATPSIASDRPTQPSGEKVVALLADEAPSRPMRASVNADKAVESRASVTVPTTPASAAASFASLLDQAAAMAPAAHPTTTSSPSLASAGPAVEIRFDTSPLAAHFREAIGVQVSMLAQDGVQEARLHLNPAEMGPISIRIALDGNQAQVDFAVDSATTRAVLESGLPELASALREAGLTLTGGGVSDPSSSPPSPSTSQRQGDSAQQQRSDAQAQAQSGRRSAHHGADEAPMPAPARRMQAGTGGLDLYA